MKTFIYKLRRLHPDAIFAFYNSYVYLEYRANGKYHNTKGPAIQAWSIQGVLVRQEYRINGLLHNTEGPAFKTWTNRGNLFRQEYWEHGALIKIKTFK